MYHVLFVKSVFTDVQMRKKIQFPKTAAKPCTAEVKTAIFFSIKLGVINVETDRQ
jgi:hypothetical protein